MLINRHLIAVFTALIPATVVAQTPNVTACDPGACYAYGQLLKIDRDQAVAAGYAWIAPRDTRPIVMIQTLPTGSALPPVDDEVRLRTNGRELWSVVYRDAGSPGIFDQTKLDFGPNNVEVSYANTQPPDAHFFIQVGGVAFAGTPTWGREYREGLTFGTGLLQKLLPAGVITSARVWRSKIDPPGLPAADCVCKNLPLTFDFEELKKLTK